MRKEVDASRERFLSSSCALIKIVRSDYFARINVVNDVVSSLYGEEMSVSCATDYNQFLGYYVTDMRSVQLIIYKVFMNDRLAEDLLRNLMSYIKISYTKFIRF